MSAPSQAEVIDYKIPDGIGARFSSDGKTFIGFFKPEEMIMNKLKIQILSVPHKEKLIAEIQNGDYTIAEISNDKGKFEIEFFSYGDRHIEMSLEEFIDILYEAKRRLSGHSV